IVSDYGSNIDRIQRIINALDVPGFEEQLEVIPVKFAKAKDIAELVNKIVNKGDSRNQPGGGFVAGMPRGSISSRGSQGGAFFMVIPDDRTNALIVSGNKAGIDRIRQLLKRLDFRMSPEDSGGFYVYTVRHGDAKKIATTLQGVIKESSPRPGGGAPSQPFISPITGLQQPTQEIFGSEVKIQADETTNSLVIVASKQDYDTMQSLLAQLDRPRDQVFVEAIIMEMQASDAFSWQIGGFQFQGNSGVKAGFNTLDPSTLGDLLTPTGGSGAIIPFGTGNPLEITQLNGTKVTLPSTLGFVNFLKKNANANVLSTPQILALDNQEALIEVGDKVVVGSSLQTTQYGSTETPQFEDATISLKITPSISSTIESVRLQIDGSVKQISSAATPSAFQSKTQPLATRKIKTSIVVPNQATAVLGGLMKDDQIEKVSKVPLLGDIPILGWLFKSRATQTVKTNLVVLLTPKIVKTDQDQRELLGRTLKERLDYVKKTGGLDPYGNKMDQVSKGEVFGPLKSSAAGVLPKSEVDTSSQEKKKSTDSPEEPPMEYLDSVKQ
ncbi:MAG: type II secretion system secretin GspD, partial [Bdellovibrio sp.]